MGSEEGSEVAQQKGRRSREDQIRELVDSLSPQEQEVRLGTLLNELIGHTRLEVNGELDTVQMNAVSRTRGLASELFRRTESTKYLSALNAGIIDCIPEQEWERIVRLPNADPGVRQLIDYFGEKRKAQEETVQPKPPQEPGQ